MIQGCRRLRHVSYAQAEEDCALLGERLTQRFGRGALREFQFVAIPRGGLLVLGMLSYVLDLRHLQLSAPPMAQRPVVVVDDCALTGKRFAQFLQGNESGSVVFAHLYSHPDLRRAIEFRESRVLACVGARDLHDCGPQLHPANYSALQASWIERLEGERYWAGLTEHISFAWSEPDRLLWSAAEERFEALWGVAPPEHCLKRRYGSCEVPGELLQFQPEGKGPLQPAGMVVAAEVDDGLIVGNMDSGRTYLLQTVAADMWRAIVAHGALEPAARSLCEDYSVELAAVRADLQGFLVDLIRRGLIEDASAPGIDGR